MISNRRYTILDLDICEHLYRYCIVWILLDDTALVMVMVMVMMALEMAMLMTKLKTYENWMDNLFDITGDGVWHSVDLGMDSVWVADHCVLRSACLDSTFHFGIKSDFPLSNNVKLTRGNFLED